MTNAKTYRAICRGALALMLGVAVVGVGSGCKSGKGPVATDVDPVEATPEYWWENGPEVKLELADFDRTFNACQSVLRDKLFEIDRADSRSGTITTIPLTGAQWFEVWRPDNSTPVDVTKSSLATFRRTVRFELVRIPNGRYSLTTRVLVERQSVAGRRLSGVLGFRSFTNSDQSTIRAVEESGVDAPATYWYAVGRDRQLETRLADAVVKKVY